MLRKLCKRLVPSPHRASAACGPRLHSSRSHVQEGRASAAHFKISPSVSNRKASTLPSPDLARQIAEIDAQIADAEARIFQHQKRVENMLARGGDACELSTTIAALTKRLADLEAQKGELFEKMSRS
jgi:hypothetical protein